MVEMWFPMYAVSRGQNDETILLSRSDNRLVAGVGRSIWILVFEYGRVPCVDSQTIHSLAGQDDIIRFGASEFMQAELRSLPNDPVAALHRRESRMAVRSQLAIGKVDMHGFVVHAIPVAILENTVVAAGRSFPRFIVNDSDFPRLRVMQL